MWTLLAGRLGKCFSGQGPEYEPGRPVPCMAAKRALENGGPDTRPRGLLSMTPSAFCPSPPGGRAPCSPSPRLSPSCGLCPGSERSTCTDLRPNSEPAASSVGSGSRNTLHAPQDTPSLCPHPSGSALISSKQPSQTPPNWLRHPSSAHFCWGVCSGISAGDTPGVGRKSRHLCSPAGAPRPRHRRSH